VKSIITPTAHKENIDLDYVIKKEARGVDGADFGEVQLIMGDKSSLRKVLLLQIKTDFTCQKAL
jgi:hypothetical protein